MYDERVSYMYLSTIFDFFLLLDIQVDCFSASISVSGVCDLVLVSSM